jgi:outer membrane protein TolC
MRGLNRVFLIASLWPVYAQAMSLTEAIQYSWNVAPLLHQQLEADQRLYEVSKIEKAQRLLPNEPQVFYGNTDDRTSELYGVSDTIGFPGKALAFMRQDRIKSENAHSEWEAKRFEVTQVVVQTYLDSAVALATVDQQKRNISDAETLASSLRARYEAGLATQAEVIGSDLQIRQQRADLAAAQDKAKVSIAKLKKLLNLTSDPSPLELPDDLEADVISRLGSRTADERRAQSAAALAESTRRLSWWSQAPDLSLSAQRNRYDYLPGSPSGRLYTYSYTVGITAPIFFPFYEWTAAKRQREQARLDEQTARLQLLSAESDRQGAVQEYERSRGRLKEIREKDLPLAEALMESTFSAYRSGKLGYAELTLARKTLNDLRAQDIQLRSSSISAHLRCLEEGGKGS